MLRIRVEQVVTFREAELRNFEDRMLKHLKQFAPTHVRFLEERDLRKVIQLGLEQASKHGLHSARGARIYTELMFLLGSAFDADPQYPWAIDILRDPRMPETSKINRLFETAWDYAEQVMLDYHALKQSGHQGQLLVQLHKLRDNDDVVLMRDAVPRLRKRTLEVLEDLFPSKCSYIGRPCLGHLFERAVESACQYDLETERGALIFVAMMFVFGSGFDTDPLLPWMVAAVRVQDATARSKRIDLLNDAATQALQRWWS